MNLKVQNELFQHELKKNKGSKKHKIVLENKELELTLPISPNKQIYLL